MMGFLGSREFLLSGAVGVLLAAFFLSVPTLFPGVASAVDAPCDAPAGDALAPDEDRQDGAARSIAYHAAPGTALRLCLDVGDVHVLPHDGDDVRFTIDVHSRGREAAQRVADTAFTLVRAGDTVALAQTAGSRTSWWFGGEGAVADVTVLVPRNASMAYGVDVDVGDVTARGLRGAQAQSWVTDVGDVDVAYDAIAGVLRVATDVGDVDLALPAGDDAPGYRVDVEADVGELRQEHPDLVVVRQDGNPPGVEALLESRDLAERSLRVDVTVRVDVGNVGFSASGVL